VNLHKVSSVINNTPKDYVVLSLKLFAFIGTGGGGIVPYVKFTRNYTTLLYVFKLFRKNWTTMTPSVKGNSFSFSVSIRDVRIIRH
jgi:hypothetical protein